MPDVFIVQRTIDQVSNRFFSLIYIYVDCSKDNSRGSDLQTKVFLSLANDKIQLSETIPHAHSTENIKKSNDYHLHMNTHIYTWNLVQ